ncbi:Coenzyme F420 hydrogenase/dehydrogenase, beta subunit C-terminal domain [Roseobacter litoralis]|uniref:Coenzyme F420 hydrogenase/dehydrogenase, subunit beta n=1 Tax=Roseobacter litoralis (strain ATCC 49566 / DSM 6996 / JCM 21268 / NBRC 15278 / OCh 149) TaxID=391595 RepID=F7ZIF8_ROSLO|nr:Coenzyme F420 hydrogenase/dehydrogenase, beta subunit C-terminal domain [Roseobacter litoralis]AEI92477.1 putative coenzyme F420 hydrogenase/dehydrogenase, subunit beta [Roseobacter litoralis Och 149]
MLTPDFRDPAPRGLCTDCGVSRFKDPRACGKACQFIAPDYPALEKAVHGRTRGAGDETFFGPFKAMHRARMVAPAEGAQWTGITTALAADLLTRGRVDAVLTMVPDDADSWRPKPALITEASDMARARGMRMGYAPLLALLEEAQAQGFKRLAVIGIPCQIYALRALEADLGLERLYVIGTPCSDNTTTENFHTFLKLLDEAPETITYLEFRADFKVELRFTDGRQRLIPFLSLPISDLPRDFFPLTCRTCVDYTNSLADITVGYMGGEGDQWLLVRNARGAEMLEGLGARIHLQAPGSAGKRANAVKGFIANTARAAGGLPLRRMPDWLRPIVSWLQPRIGPRGLEFARTRVEMKAAETILHLRREEPAKMKNMVPDHVWKVAEPYDLKPQDGERATQADVPEK